MTDWFEPSVFACHVRVSGGATWRPFAGSFCAFEVGLGMPFALLLLTFQPGTTRQCHCPARVVVQKDRGSSHKPLGQTIVPVVKCKPNVLLLEFTSELKPPPPKGPGQRPAHAGVVQGIARP